jgi:putative PIN family toxin of toxin-antitoxin system
MRAVADTNIVVSGLLWHGPPRQVLDAARNGVVSLFTSADLLAELEEVLSREKFRERLHRAAVQLADLVNGFAALATVVRPAAISPVVLGDPDDDAVIACAVAASAEVIVSGDDDLLTLKRYEGIEVLKASEFLSRIQSAS